MELPIHHQIVTLLLRRPTQIIESRKYRLHLPEEFEPVVKCRVTALPCLQSLNEWHQNTEIHSAQHLVNVFGLADSVIHTGSAAWQDETTFPFTRTQLLYGFKLVSESRD